MVKSLHPRCGALVAPLLLMSLVSVARAQPPRLIALSNSLSLGGPNVPGYFDIQSTSSWPALADTGVVVFNANVIGFYPTSWVNRGSGNNPIYVPNVPVAEMPGWVYYGGRGSSSAGALGDQGQVVTVQRIDSPTLTSTDALVEDTGSGPHVLATRLTVAPGVVPSPGRTVHFSTFDDVRVSNERLAFTSTTDDTGSSFKSGIWVSAGGMISKVMYTGEATGTSTDRY